MNRRDFLERFFYALSAALLALFGFRADLTHDDVRRSAKTLARKAIPSFSDASASDILKKLFPQQAIYRVAYGAPTYR